MCVSYSILFYPGRSVKPVLMLRTHAAREPEQGVPPAKQAGSRTRRCLNARPLTRERRVFACQFLTMKVQQTLAQTWKRRRDSDHATAKRLIEERGVGLLRVPDELLDLILGYSDLGLLAPRM